jgi:hypothetical protein
MMFVGDNGEAIVRLGDGDIVVSNANAKGHPEQEVVLSCSDSGAHPIGEVIEHHVGISTKDLAGPVIRMQFTRVESVDVVVEALLRARSALAGVAP